MTIEQAYNEINVSTNDGKESINSLDIYSSNNDLVNNGGLAKFHRDSQINFNASEIYTTAEVKLGTDTTKTSAAGNKDSAQALLKAFEEKSQELYKGIKETFSSENLKKMGVDTNSDIQKDLLRLQTMHEAALPYSSEIIKGLLLGDQSRSLDKLVENINRSKKELANKDLSSSGDNAGILAVRAQLGMTMLKNGLDLNFNDKSQDLNITYRSFDNDYLAKIVVDTTTGKIKSVLEQKYADSQTGDKSKPDKIYSSELNSDNSKDLDNKGRTLFLDILSKMRERVIHNEDYKTRTPKYPYFLPKAS